MILSLSRMKLLWQVYLCRMNQSQPTTSPRECCLVPLGATLARTQRVWLPPSLVSLSPFPPACLPRVLCLPVSLQGGKVHSRRTIIPYQGVPRNPCAVHIALYIAWQPRRTPTARRAGGGRDSWFMRNPASASPRILLRKLRPRREHSEKPSESLLPFSVSPAHARAVPLAARRRSSRLRVCASSVGTSGGYKTQRKMMREVEERDWRGNRNFWLP